MKKTYSNYTPSKNWFYFLLLLTLMTLGFHSYLSSQHYNLKLGASTGPSICNVSASFNCDAVAASTYSAIFNIPIALLGFIAQAVLLILAIASHYSLSENSNLIRRVTFWLALLIALVSVVMGFISTFKMGTKRTQQRSTYQFQQLHRH